MPGENNNEGGEKVEGLDEIGKLGAALETPAPGQSTPGAVVVMDRQAEITKLAAALGLVRTAAIPFAPEHVQPQLTGLWSDAQLMAVADAVLDVCTIHGWTVDDFYGVWGPYLKLAMVLGMPALATIKLLKLPPPAPAAAQNGQQQ